METKNFQGKVVGTDIPNQTLTVVIDSISDETLLDFGIEGTRVEIRIIPEVSKKP